MDLYFLRHGIAADREDWSEDDTLRPLTEDGAERLAKIAAVLVRLRLGLTAVVTSPLVRARQTAEIVARALGLQDALEEDERLAPGFGLAQLDGILHAHPDARALMLVGHEPDFSDAIGALIGGGRVVCKKGGVALVSLPDPGSLDGELVWLAPPRLLLA